MKDCRFKIGQKARLRGFCKMRVIERIEKDGDKYVCILENGMRVPETDLCTTPWEYNSRRI